MKVLKTEPREEEFIITLTTLEARNLLLDLESESKEFRTTTRELIKVLKAK